MSTPDAYFEGIYREDDPFGYRQRWFEQRKRQLLLAALPCQRFRSGWELGCSNGELTAVLAERCDKLLATDLALRAVELTRARTAALPQVCVRQARHPVDWPEQDFDLIVFSEIGYYLDEQALIATAHALARSLRPDGVLVACHWRHAFAEAPLQGDQVHACLDAELGLAQLLDYLDQDVRLQAWSPSARSLAQRDGLR